MQSAVNLPADIARLTHGVDSGGLKGDRDRSERLKQTSQLNTKSENQQEQRRGEEALKPAAPSGADTTPSITHKFNVDGQEATSEWGVPRGRPGEC